MISISYHSKFHPWSTLKSFLEFTYPWPGLYLFPMPIQHGISFSTRWRKFPVQRYYKYEIFLSQSMYIHSVNILTTWTASICIQCYQSCVLMMLIWNNWNRREAKAENKSCDPTLFTHAWSRRNKMLVSQT